VNSLTADELRRALRCDRSSCACQRGRSVHCPVHADRSPSFAIGQGSGRLLVHCFAGCNQETVIDALRTRALWPSAVRGPAVPRTQLEEARQRAVVRERAATARRDRYRTLSQAADVYRETMRDVRAARRVATTTGPSDAAWALLEEAARLETLTEAGRAEVCA
jgi:hypothetical protein